MSRRTKIILTVGALVLLSLAALQTPLLTIARHATWELVVLSVGRLAGWQHLRIDDPIQEEIAALRADNIRLQAELHDYQRLRQQLDSPGLSSHQAIPALITSRTLDPWQTRLVLNRGTRHGVTIGAPVVVNKSTLVGHVIELSENTSLIQLLIHPETSLPAEILESENGKGLARGSAHTALLLTTIPRDVEIQLEQPVVTIADENTPPGLVLGYIQSARNEENEAYQSARLRLPYDPSNIFGVNILLAP